MPVVVSEGQQFSKPPAGLYHAVCCDVIDRGVVHGAYGPRHKVDIRWQLDAISPDTKERFVVNKRYTASLFKGAILAQDLQSWRGQPFTPEEKKAFDLERLLGVNCQINIVHVERDGVVYANVTTVVPLAKGQQKIAVDSYVRFKDRDENEGTHQTEDDHEYSDDDVPF